MTHSPDLAQLTVPSRAPIRSNAVRADTPESSIMPSGLQPGYIPSLGSDIDRDNVAREIQAHVESGTDGQVAGRRSVRQKLVMDYKDDLRYFRLLLFRLSDRRFVLEERRDRDSEFRSFVDIIAGVEESDGVPTSFTCSCSVLGNCVHTQVFHEHYGFLVPALCMERRDENQESVGDVVLLGKVDAQGYQHTLYSVSSSDGTRSHKRAVVTHHDYGWNCSRCRTTPLVRCQHACRVVREYTPAAEPREQPLEAGQKAEDWDVVLGDSPLDRTVEHDSIVGTPKQRPIARGPIPPPRALWIQEHDRVRPVREDHESVPLIFKLTAEELDGHARCSNPNCSAGPDPLEATIRQPCTVYTLTLGYKCEIEVRACKCSRLNDPAQARNCGPDLTAAGFFNWNNDTVLSLQLLYECTTLITAIDGSFTSWISTKHDTYFSSHLRMYGGSSHPTQRGLEAKWDNFIDFLPESCVISIWTAFAQLLAKTDVNVCCSTCGREPSIVVADAISLTRHWDERGSLQGPTTLGPDAEQCRKTFTPNATILPAQSQKVVRTSLNAFAGLPMIGRFQRQACKDAYDQLRLADPRANNDSPVWEDSPFKAVAEVFRFLGQEGADAVDPGQSPEHRGKTIAAILQLLREVSSPDMVLQIVPSGYEDLQVFADNPFAGSTVTSRHLYGRLALRNPAFADVYERYMSRKAVPACIRKLAASVLDKSRQVLAELEEKDVGRYRDNPAPSDMEVPTGEPLWVSTGASYGDKYRTRPHYTEMDKDSGVRSSGPNGDTDRACNKYYLEYGNRYLTGGMLALWCPHGYCVGWHAIAKDDGRNDVFSALLCHWKEAPKVVIYDFACALGRYCLQREPEFFKNTLFAVDKMHAKGHASCPIATHLDTYTAKNPELRDAESSIAECGIAGLRYIRDLVNSASEEVALSIVWAYLWEWNRRSKRGYPREEVLRTMASLDADADGVALNSAVHRLYMY